MVFKQAAFGFVVDEFQGSRIGLAGFGGAAKPSEQLAARGVEVLVWVQMQPVHDREPGIRAIGLGDRDRTAQLDHRGIGHASEFAV